MFDFRKKYALEAKAQEALLRLNPLINENSGIYMFERTDEHGVKYAYVGQAKNLMARLTQHLVARLLSKSECSHVDNSLYKRKLYSERNPAGWTVAVANCPIEKLDENERKMIEVAAETGYVLYNITSGGQNRGKKDINERSQEKLKRYKNGRNFGYLKAREEVRVFFEKYLDYSIKGKPSKIKEKKLKEFEGWLKGD